MISVVELFKIGIGPSSSHTVGPMVAAGRFLALLNIEKVRRVVVELYGSLAATGKGHATDTAIMLGLLGHTPQGIDTTRNDEYLAPVLDKNRMQLGGVHEIDFDPKRDIIWHMDASLPYHPNALSLSATLDDNSTISQTYYSVGGGFVIDQNQIGDDSTQDGVSVPYPFDSAEQILTYSVQDGVDLVQIARANESVYRDDSETNAYLDKIWAVMQDCVKAGCVGSGILPGGLSVRRRAKDLHTQLACERDDGRAQKDPLRAMDWVDLYALAVNEENAGGGKVVTAPTNGAAGIVPAVLHYYRDFVPSYSIDGARNFLLVAGMIGALIKMNASISGAEVGCQGEVGSACAMAAAALAYVLGGSTEQCLNAAEIGLEHNLGLTCDPIAGLVQVPCIERNAMASVKAINAARLALRGDGKHCVSLDKAILTMKQTGIDMMDKYKETARGGLAVYADNRTDSAKMHIPVVSVGQVLPFSQC